MGVFQAIGLAAELEQAAVVDDAIDHGSSHGVITEDGAPAGEFQVGGDDQTALFIAVGNDLE